WLRLASVAPRLANLLSDAPGARQVIQRVLHIAPARQIPRLAPVSFRKWARGHGLRTVGVGHGDGQAISSDTVSRRVILWVDTFSNHFHPETGRAALDVLRAAGCEVVLPAGHLCCGRPLYDFGLLDRAKAYLRAILDALAEAIDTGIPLVVL